jgi:hypothetical protein
MSRSGRHAPAARALCVAGYHTLADAEAFFARRLDVVVFAVSIVAFAPTVRGLAPWGRRLLPMPINTRGIET